MLSKADKVFIGKSIYNMESSLERASENYREETQFLSYNDLAGLRKELDDLRMAIHHFYNVFCPSVDIDEYDVMDFVELYKTVTVADYYKLKNETKLTDFDLFGRTWNV